VDDARYFDEGKLVVFKRNRIYQHRSFLNGTYVWRTLKTSTLEEAITRAQKAHYYLLAQQEQGLPIKATLFRDVIDEYVASREKSASQGKTKPGMLRQIKRVVKFWREYAGSKRIHDIGDAVFSDYVEWRRDYYTNLYVKLGKPPAAQCQASSCRQDASVGSHAWQSHHQMGAREGTEGLLRIWSPSLSRLS
jgi:hypothetical protein